MFPDVFMAAVAPAADNGVDLTPATFQVNSRLSGGGRLHDEIGLYLARRIHP
jgi:hypothetical protein